MDQAPYHPKVTPLPGTVRPRVSVIIPCYNYGHWLAECVESVLRQDDEVDVEIIIVNDASTDHSSEVAQGLAARDARIRVIEHARNFGHIPSVNEALQQVQGDYIVKLDADDMLTPGSLGRSTALLEAHPSVGFVYGRPLHFGCQADMNMPRLQRWLRRETYVPLDRPPERRLDLPARRWTIWPGMTWLAMLCARGANCISQPEVVIRTRTLRSLGPYDEALPHTSDLAMWLALSSVSDVGHVDGAIQGLYRVHPNSMQRTVNAGKVRDLRARLAAFDSILKAPLRKISGADKLVWTAHQRLAREALEEVCRAFDRGRTRTEPMDDYIAFAFEAYPEASSLPEWRGLQWRRRIGPRWSPYCPPFLLKAVQRRAFEEMVAARWWRQGI